LIDLPKRWKKPRVIFVNSMSDLFQDEVPDTFVRQVFDTMAECPQHTFQILTKRSKRLQILGPSLPWPSNVWMGVSVEDSRAIERVHDLSAVPAKVRFIKPLLVR
jgi:protein gp37